VFCNVLTPCHYGKILGPIVLLVTVLMVNYFIERKRTPQHFFRDPSVFVPSTHFSIPVGRAAIALGTAIILSPSTRLLSGIEQSSVMPPLEFSRD
jgi:cytosine/uracil/thiamine/allantoin permease